jgi:hypothetical protein
MANDRIRMRCKVCEADFLLFKYYPGEGGVLVSGLEDFMREHLNRCHPNAYGENLAGDSGFTLETESSPPTASPLSTARR